MLDACADDDMQCSDKAIMNIMFICMAMALLGLFVTVVGVGVEPMTKGIANDKNGNSYGTFGT